MSLSSHPPPLAEDHDMEKEGEKGAQTTEAIAGIPISEEAIRNGSVNPETILKHAIDGDEALKAFANYHGSVIHIDEATNKRLLRKIDMNLMPVCLWFLHYHVIGFLSTQHPGKS
jgi:hypothetical protein